MVSGKNPCIWTAIIISFQLRDCWQSDGDAIARFRSFQALMPRKCMNKKSSKPNLWIAKTRALTSISSCLWKLKKNSSMRKAALQYKEIVKYDPQTEKFFEKHVRLLLRTGQLDEAVKAGQEAIKRFPKNKKIHMDLADILASQGKADASIYHYERVHQIAPKSSRAIFLKGTVLEGQGKWIQAKDMYWQAAKMEHNNPLGQFYLGRALLHNNELKEAEKRFQMSVILKPNLLQARKYLAWVYERLGKHEEALKEYNLLLKLKLKNSFIDRTCCKTSESLRPCVYKGNVQPQRDPRRAGKAAECSYENRCDLF